MSIAEKYNELLKKNPWKYEGGTPASILMGYDDEKKKYAVLVMNSYWDGGWPSVRDKDDRDSNFLFLGSTIERALDKALREAEK